MSDAIESYVQNVSKGQQAVFMVNAPEVTDETWEEWAQAFRVFRRAVGLSSSAPMINIPAVAGDVRFPLDPDRS